MEQINLSCGCGQYEIHATAVLCGGDLSVTLCGGTLMHVGAVSLAVYEPERDSATVSTVTVFTHRDDHLSSRVAKQLSSALKCTVTVTAGVHIDSAAPDDIKRFCEAADALALALCGEITLQRAAAPPLPGQPL